MTYQNLWDIVKMVLRQKTNSNKTGTKQQNLVKKQKKGANKQSQKKKKPNIK